MIYRKVSVEAANRLMDWAEAHDVDYDVYNDVLEQILDGV